MVDELTKMLEKAEAKEVDKTINTIIERNIEQLQINGIKGRHIIPINPQNLALVIAGDYYQAARSASNSSQKLLQYTIVLAAAKKSGDSNARNLCLEAIQTEFPDLPERTKGYIARYQTS